MSKIDTQGMSLPSTDKEWKVQPHGPMEVKEIPLLEPKLKQELKELINEVLDERELQKKLNGPYDLPEYI
tara:strand:- start:115 stop:324 length:210 start_codon:yes stop_codon:yes gene_type:complete